jgi:hypothetical protein
MAALAHAACALRSTRMQVKPWVRRLLLGALLALAGCYKATFHESATAVRGRQHEQWSDFFILGLVGSQTFEVAHFCGAEAVAEIRTGGNFLTGLVSVITIGIYTPRKAYVTCAAGNAQSGRRSRTLEVVADLHGVPVEARVAHGASVAQARLEHVEGGSYRVRVQEPTP